MEFLCRIAIKLFEDNKEEGLDYKVQNFMVKMYEQQQILDPLKAKKVSPEIDICFHYINEEEDC